MPNADPIPRGLPLVAYAENLCKGARVLVVAETPLPIAEAVLSRGARLVHVFESDKVRRAEAEARCSSAEITFGAPTEWRHEGVFDLVLVENLGVEADPDTSMRGFAKLLAPRGSALIAAPNPETHDPFSSASESRRSLDYYALYGAVSAALPHVRMLGQVPFAGYALIDFAAEGDPAPVFDTSLLPPRGEEPGYFVAFGSRQPQVLEGYVVVQVPAASVIPARPPAVPAAPARPPAPAVAAPPPIPAPVPPTPAPAPSGPSRREKELEQLLRKQEAWIAELEARAAIADERADAADAELDELREQIAHREQAWTQERTASVDEASSGKAELESLRRRAHELDNLLELRTKELLAARGEGARLENALAAVEVKLAGSSKEQQAQIEELTAARAELSAARAELTAARAELGATKAELASASDEASVAVEIQNLEAQLLQQGQKIRGLERDLREAERTGRELVRKLTAQRVIPVASAVAERLVEAEAELVSLRWSLQMLGRGTGSSSPATSS